MSAAAVRHAVAAQRARRAEAKPRPAPQLYQCELTRREDEPSFGLALNKNMRVISVDVGSPCYRAGLSLLDRVVEVDGTVSTAGTIAAQVADRLSAMLLVERPSLEEQPDVAEEEHVVEWLAWVRACIAAAEGTREELIEWCHVMIEHELDPWASTLTEQEAAYLVVVEGFY